MGQAKFTLKGNKFLKTYCVPELGALLQVSVELGIAVAHMLKPTSLGAVIYKRHMWIPFILEITAPLPLYQLNRCVFWWPVLDSYQIYHSLSLCKALDYFASWGDITFSIPTKQQAKFVLVYWSFSVLASWKHRVPDSATWSFGSFSLTFNQVDWQEKEHSQNCPFLSHL